jgi:CubicO group peptidase (beta-lactamase class C family)
MIDRRLLLTSAAATAAAPSLASAEAAPDALGKALVRAINSGDVEPWVKAWVSAEAQKHRPVAFWTEAFAKMRAVSGGVKHERDLLINGVCNVLVRPAARDALRPIMVFIDQNAPGKVWDYLPFAVPLPYERALVSGPTDRVALREAVEHRVLTAVRQDDFSGALLIGDPAGGTLYAGPFGKADRSTGEAITLEHRFHLGSADKSFTAVMIGQLIDEGRLKLETRVVDVLPSYPNREAAEAITIRHLLTHSAGLGELWDRSGYKDAAPYSRVSDLLASFAGEPLKYRPGERAEYSNEGFVLLGAIIEAVTGKSWWDELQARVYTPAGMRRSGHFLHRASTPQRARGYRFAEADLVGLGERQLNSDGLGMGYRGNSCGGGYSTVADMTAYLRALRSGKLMSAARTETFTSEAQGGLGYYGMGFQHAKVNGRTIRGHSGGGARSGINVEAAVVWETGWTYAVLGNYDTPFAQNVARDIGTMLAAQTA